jgi:ATP-dependent DNA ligase
MAAQVVKRLPEGDDWIYELKFDGYRALIIKDKQQVELRSRKNKDLTGMYREIAAAGLRVKADEMGVMQWVRPKLVAQIRFVEWTAESRLRHAAVLVLRSDKAAEEFRCE